MGLRVAGRKNLTDHSGQRLHAQRVDEDRDLVPTRNGFEISFCHRRFKTQLQRILHLEQRLPRRSQFTCFYFLFSNHAVERRLDDGITQLGERRLPIRLSHLERTCGVLQFLTRDGIVFQQRLHSVELRLRVLHFCRGPSQIGLNIAAVQLNEDLPLHNLSAFSHEKFVGGSLDAARECGLEDGRDLPGDFDADRNLDGLDLNQSSLDGCLWHS